MQVIITRAEAESRATADLVTAAGCTAVIAPLAEAVFLPFTLPDRRFDAIIITSRNGLARLQPAHLSRLSNTKLFCVGASGAQRAKQSGFADIVCAPDVRQLIDTVLSGSNQGQSALYLAGEPRKPDLEQALEGRIDLTTLTIYRMVEAQAFPAETLARITDLHPVWLHYSQQSAQRAATLVARSSKPELFRQGRHLVLSPAIGETVAALGGTDITTAARPDQTAMMQSLLTIRQASAG